MSTSATIPIMDSSVVNIHCVVRIVAAGDQGRTWVRSVRTKWRNRSGEVVSGERYRQYNRLSRSVLVSGGGRSDVPGVSWHKTSWQPINRGHMAFTFR
jgi:hypothetical protein